jgi:hypothetical protein
MSDHPTEDEIRESSIDAVSYDPTYTITVNGKEYGLNETVREHIQDRAQNEYAENERFSCWWKVASQRDAKESDIHEVGDPILVIETEGYKVPWDQLDKLEVEEQSTDSFEEVNAGGGMQAVDPSDDGDEGTREKERTHFEVTPQDFEDMPSPDGESPDKVPAQPETFSEPTMVMWIPDDPDVEHTWSAGTALTPMVNWVEWNAQAKANQPRTLEEKDDSHNHWESMLKSNNCQVVQEVQQSDDGQQSRQSQQSDTSGSVKRKGKNQFEDGKMGGSNWDV